MRLLAGLISALLMTPAAADDLKSVISNLESVEAGVKEPGYSPFAGRNFPTKVLWGDTHLHTNLSLDARAFGVTLGPIDAYRLARGDEITTTWGQQIKLSRPLDWLVVSDHSDGMGTMNEIVKGNPALLRDPVAKDWYRRITSTRVATWRLRQRWKLSRRLPACRENRFRRY
jgi:hypothetical protein